MSIIIDYSKGIGPMKPMHAVNNGPLPKPQDQVRENMTAYQQARIPYARNHDASHCSSYGGDHTVDIHSIFPNFDADVDDPASYDFVMTDFYLNNIRSAGTRVFYRLGSSIEHWRKKYHTLPPKDFLKWSKICEHIIMHYNEGWADGYHWGIEYWEIWNEPDLDPDNSPNKRCWGGTQAQFHELYRTAAIYLKNRFPHLKIGGPALAHNMEWMERFLADMKKDNVPLDFFSWHIYTTDPMRMVKRAGMIREMLDSYGYTDAESILNEWNYIENWDTKYIDSIRTIIGLKGAVFIASCMCAAQNSSIDMLMYYDARPNTVFNGLFDFYTLEKLKGYYPFPAFAKLYELGNQVYTQNDEENVYTVSASDGNGKIATMLCYYDEKDLLSEKDIRIHFKNGFQPDAKCFLLDETHDLELSDITISNEMTITMQPNTMILITNV